MSKALLLISQQKEDLEFAEVVAQVAGLTVKVLSNPKEAAPHLAAGGSSTIFVDVSTLEQYQALEVAIHDTVGLFSDKVNPNHIHFISLNEIQYAQFPLQSPLFGNFIHRNYGSDLEALKKTAQQYGRLVKASLADKAFGLLNYLAPNAKIQIVKFKNTNQKQAGVEAVKNYLLAAHFKSRMAAVIANCVDEVLMNAMFDAPIDATGRPIHAALSRNTAIALDDRNAVEMHVGFDGTRVGITVIDQFGSLDRGKLLSHIAKKYTEDAYKLKNVVAGAGIGLATVFSTGGSLLFVSENGVRTEVSLFFMKTDNFVQFKNQFHFLAGQFYF